MSSQSKRRAESEEVAHKKKPRKGGDEEEEFDQNEDDGEATHDKSGIPDEDNIIPTNGRTRGNRIDYKEVGGPDDDNGSEFGDELQKDKTGAPSEPRTRSPQRKLATNVENLEDLVEEEDDEEDEEYGGDDGGDEEEEGEYYDSDEDE